MNLHRIASGAISRVNPMVRVVLQISTGSVTGANGKRIPQYDPPVGVQGQVQALSYGDIQQLDSLNIQGERRAIYLNGKIDGLVRPENKGGDLIRLPNGSRWLVAMILEYWPDWVKAAITLQRTGLELNLSDADNSQYVPLITGVTSATVGGW